MYQQFLVSFPSIPFPETIKLRIRDFFHARRNSFRTCHYEIECRKALWSQGREVLWSNCKRTQSSTSRFVLCKKYELLLRSLHSNETFLNQNGHIQCWTGEKCDRITRVYWERNMEVKNFANPQLTSSLVSLRSWRSQSMRRTVFTGTILYWWQMGLTKLRPSVSHLPPVQDGAREHCSPHRLRPPATQAIVWLAWGFCGTHLPLRCRSLEITAHRNTRQWRWVWESSRSWSRSPKGCHRWSRSWTGPSRTTLISIPTCSVCLRWMPLSYNRGVRKGHLWLVQTST